MDLCLDSTRCGSGGGGGGGIGGGRGDRVVVVGVVCHVFAVTLTPPIVSIAIPFGVTFLDPNYTFGETKKGNTMDALGSLRNCNDSYCPL